MSESELSGEEQYHRMHHPLRLPKGSVRALITLSSLGTVAWLVHTGGLGQLRLERPEVVFTLLISVILMVTYYFASRRGGFTSPAEGATRKHPLFLPRGSVRFLLLAGIGGIIFLLHRSGDLFPDGARYALLIAIMVGFFALGQVVRGLIDMVLGRLTPEEPGTVRIIAGHVQAVVALLVVVGYCILLASGWFEGDRSLDLVDIFDKLYLGVVGFYFGNRHA